MSGYLFSANCFLPSVPIPAGFRPDCGRKIGIPPENTPNPAGFGVSIITKRSAAYIP